MLNRVDISSREGWFSNIISHDCEFSFHCNSNSHKQKGIRQIRRKPILVMSAFSIKFFMSMLNFPAEGVVPSRANYTTATQSSPDWSLKSPIQLEFSFRNDDSKTLAADSMPSICCQADSESRNRTRIPLRNSELSYDRLLNLERAIAPSTTNTVIQKKRGPFLHDGRRRLPKITRSSETNM